jgi:hypothetical protein
MAKRRMADLWMDWMSVFVGWQSTCDERQHVSKEKVIGRGRHAYKAVTTGRSFVRAQKPIDEKRCGQADTAVAILLLLLIRR